MKLVSIKISTSELRKEISGSFWLGLHCPMKMSTNVLRKAFPGSLNFCLQYSMKIGRDNYMYQGKSDTPKKVIKYKVITVTWQ